MGKRVSAERRYAEFYHLYVGDFELDLPIYLDLAAKYPGTILEVGCDTGRVALRLARAGHEVVGIGQRREMLQVGAYVLHPMFGSGRITGRQGSGDKLKLTIRFHRAGVKQVLARYAKLELTTALHQI